ncbi:Nitrogen permease regulator 2 [Perkinsus olseni]|uniref:Nitrogen permease regulator 2 n=1 Tax=Perkinsus olseni TaxID=32597 RepID=A0A7J6RYF0_PEROL|nr:Nitrogen permease regulator 2 [Perkinsus olseni]
MRLFRSRKSSSTVMEHQAGGSIYSVEGRASSLEHGPAVMDGGAMRVTNRGSTSTLNGTAEVKNSGASDPPEWDAFPLPPPRGKGALIRWDFSVVSLLPWTLRIPLRLHDCKNPKNGKLYCKWDAVLYDKLNRRELWARHGQSMHWLTLEFENPGLEKGYQIDLAYKSLQLIRVLSLILVLGGYESLHNRYPEATFGRVLLAEPLNALIYLGLIHFTIVSILVREPSPPPRSSSTASLRASHESYFQAFQSCFAWFTTTLALLWMYLGPELIAWYTWPMDEASTFCILLLVTACLYRLRFILMVAVSVYQIILFVALRASFPSVAQRHGEFFDLPTDPVIMVVSALFMAILTYSLEVLGRKDFVQSLMVTIESQRSDRLLRNVLPKRIIDTLKERQQQDLSAVSVCNTARSTAAGQLLAQTNCGQSNYLHVPNGGQQQGGYAISSQNSAAFTMQIAAASSQAQLLTGKSTKRSGVPHSRSFAGIAAAAAAAAVGLIFERLLLVFFCIV